MARLVEASGLISSRRSAAMRFSNRGFTGCVLNGANAPISWPRSRHGFCFAAAEYCSRSSGYGLARPLNDVRGGMLIGCQPHPVDGASSFLGILRAACRRMALPDAAEAAPRLLRARLVALLDMVSEVAAAGATPYWALHSAAMVYLH
jgi:hypothetical protein